MPKRTTCIALLRGINVGKAKRVAMAELRELFESLGHSNVHTLLNSGNVIFDAKGAAAGTTKLRAAIEAGIEKRFGFGSATVVITAETLAAVIAANPFEKIATDPSRYLVAFPLESGHPAACKPLLAESWKPDQLELGAHAAYLWCASGILESKLLSAYMRAAKSSATTRNWATVLKIDAAIRGA
jgi:uncharacterized protein (DUF1697 family)